MDVGRLDAPAGGLKTFLSNGHCVLAVFEDAMTCSGASVPENVQKPPRLCTKVGGLTPIDLR